MRLETLEEEIQKHFIYPVKLTYSKQGKIHNLTLWKTGHNNPVTSMSYDRGFTRVSTRIKMSYDTQIVVQKLMYRFLTK